ncbi:hypothetical protein BDQ17DRAFT_1242973 [Cyathus striatus]|nr:hypothetical protein BDQ17DRAFT_1242973 [Cyathus striatus]
MHSAVISLAWDLSHQCGLYCGCQNGIFYFKDFEENTGSEILTELCEAPGYAIEVSMMGTTLALAVGPEIHIASKLISRHFMTTNILPKPSHPQNLSNSDDQICWDLKESLKLWTINPIFRHMSISNFVTSGYSSLSPDSSHILVSNLKGGMVIFSVSKLTMLRRFHYPVNQSRNEPVTTVFLNNARHVACGSYNGTINISHVCTRTVVQTLENSVLL